MKFKCTTDTTKKFTPGKVYETSASNALHNVAIRDDSGRTRVFRVTHNGEGIRWNVGGNKSAVMKKLHPTFRIDELGTAHISDGEVTRVKIGGWGETAESKRERITKIAIAATLVLVSVAVFVANHF